MEKKKELSCSHSYFYFGDLFLLPCLLQLCLVTNQNYCLEIPHSLVPTSPLTHFSASFQRRYLHFISETFGNAFSLEINVIMVFNSCLAYIYLKYSFKIFNFIILIRSVCISLWRDGCAVAHTSQKKASDFLELN